MSEPIVRPTVVEQYAILKQAEADRIKTQATIDIRIEELSKQDINIKSIEDCERILDEYTKKKEIAEEHIGNQYDEYQENVKKLELMSNFTEQPEGEF